MSNALEKMIREARERIVIQEEVESKKQLAGFQLISLGIVGLTFVLWAIIEKFWPNFFNYPYWYTTQNLVGSLLKYWPLMAWGGLMALISCFSIGSSFHAKEMLIMDSLTSTLAGVWEELGFRCVYILTAMIGIWLSNLFWTGFMIISIAILVICAIAAMKKGPLFISIVSFIFAVLLCVLVWWLWGVINPVYWIYQHIIFPVINFITFGVFSNIIYNPGIPFLFIAGMISANAKFRDGHKYQGLIGFVNSWIIGFIMMTAMIYHGLIVAIILHIIYDLEFAIIRFIGRKISG